MDSVSLGNDLKVHRARKNLTQEELAELVGVTRPTINFIENARFVPSTLLALKIARGADGQSVLDSLSMRELQVLRRLAMGQTNREISRAYHISIKTVDTYRARLLKKLGLRNNAELSRFAMQNQLIEP